MIKKIVSIFKNRVFYVTLLIGLFLTSALIIAAMWLGQESGNFVIRIQNETNERSIALTVDEDPLNTSSYVTRLTTNGIGNFHDNTLRYFLHNGSEQSDLAELTSTLGVNHTMIESSSSDSDDEDSNRQSSLYCYTFYVVNTSESAFSVDVKMSYSGISKNLDSAIRVLTYNEATGEYCVYQKADSVDVDYVTEANYPDFLGVKTFESSNTVYSDESILLGLGSEIDRNPKYVKYSVMFWLEGYDPDCTDSVLGGAIKFELTLTVQS